jgi:thiosulfate/3-mercaptopyruvate sulfurtransferase
MINDKPKIILEADELESLLGKDDITVIHVSSNNYYEQLHIPTAINISARDICAKNSRFLGDLPAINELTYLFASLGYDKHQHYIVYDDEGGGWAGRFIWLLDVIGHNKYSYLNGGLLAWVKERHPIETTINKTIFNEVSIDINHAPIAELDYIENNLHNEDIVLWDARSADEYNGNKVFSKRGGHIPGAINLDWLECLDASRNYRIKHNIGSILSKIGITPNKQIITYCQIHHRSGLAYLVAKLLNYPRIKAYPKSWAEWGNLETTQID